MEHADGSARGAESVSSPRENQEAGNPPAAVPARQGTWLRMAALILMGGATAAVCLLTPSPNTPPMAGVIMDLPEKIGAFTGKVIAATPGELAILPADTQIMRREYLDSTGDRIMASIVLSGGEKRSIHRPEVCLPAQGWSMRGGKIEKLTLADGNDLDVMNLSLVRQVEVGPGDRRNLYAHYFYWFVGKNVTTPNHWHRVFLTSYDRITKNLNHRWAYVIVMSMVTEGFVPGGKNELQTVQMLKEFTSEIAPTFMRKSNVSSAD